MKGSSSSYALVTVGNIAVAGAQWYLVWLFAQQSGPSAVGEYSVLIAMMTPIFITSQLGLRNLFVTLQRRVRWRVYLGCRLTTVSLSVLTVTLLIAFAPLEVDSSLAWPILTIKVGESIADLCCARLQRSQRLVTFGLILIVTAIASASAVTVVIIGTGSIIAALWSAAAVSAAGAGSTAWFASARPADLPIEEPHPHSLRAEIRVLIAAGIPMSLMQGVYTLLSYVPLAVVSWTGTPEDVGRYASAAYLVVFANLVGASIETVVLPAFRAVHDEQGPAALRRTVRRRCLIAVFALIPFVGLALLIGPWLLASVYGPGFVLSRESVLFLSLAAVCTLPTYLASANLLVLNRYWSTFGVGAVAIIMVLVSGGIAGAAGVGAVDAGSLSVFVGSVARLGGEFFCGRPGTRPRGIRPGGRPRAGLGADAEVTGV